MAILSKDKKVILKDMEIFTSFLQLGRGLMFASKKRIDRGLCLVMPRYGRKRNSITMFFVFHPLEIIFLDQELKVVDKTILNPWAHYTPKKDCKYVIESSPKTFSSIKIGDKLKIR